MHEQDDEGVARLPATAGGLISAGERLLQIRTEKQLLVAVQRPRDEDRFAAALQREASEAGDDFFYSIPYKEHVQGCQDRRRCKCPVTMVEGPGVGLARSAARLWGNCSVETMIEEDSEDAWLVAAWFIDFESNYAKHEVKRVSKMRPTKGGKMVRAADRELDVVYQQGASKVERDVILRSLPRHRLERAFELAKYAAAMDKMPVKDQLARLLRRFGEINVTLAQIEVYLGCPMTEEGIKATERDPHHICAELRGVLTAIKGGETTAAELFPAETRPAPAGPVAASDLGVAVGGETRPVGMPAEPPEGASRGVLMARLAGVASYARDMVFIGRPRSFAAVSKDGSAWIVDSEVLAEMGKAGSGSGSDQLRIEKLGDEELRMAGNVIADICRREQAS